MLFLYYDCAIMLKFVNRRVVMYAVNRVAEASVRPRSPLVSASPWFLPSVVTGVPRVGKNPDDGAEQVPREEEEDGDRANFP